MSRAVMPAHSREIERYTPKWIFEGLNVRFDLDPCAPYGPCPSKAYCDNWMSLERGENGLTAQWSKDAFVWLNPPWTRGEKAKWIAKLRLHGSGIALVRGGVDSKWLHENPPLALFLLRGRVKYIRGDREGERMRKGNAEGGFEPSMLLGFGDYGEATLRACTLPGMCLTPPSRHTMPSLFDFDFEPQAEMSVPEAV